MVWCKLGSLACRVGAGVWALESGIRYTLRQDGPWKMLRGHPF